MAELDMSLRHNLQQDEALRRIKGLLSDVQRRFANKARNVHERWNGYVGDFSFSVFGLSTKGQLFVEPTQVRLTGKLPPGAGRYKGKVETIIREQAEALLGKP